MATAALTAVSPLVSLRANAPGVNRALDLFSDGGARLLANGGGLELNGATSLYATSSGGPLIATSGSFLSLFGEQSVILQSNGYAFLASPTAASLYGSQSLLLSSDQLVSVSSTNNALLMSGAALVSISSANSFVAATPVVQLSGSNFASFYGGLSLNAVSPGAVDVTAGSALILNAATWAELSTDTGDLSLTASTKNLLLTGGAFASLHGENSVTISSNNAPVLIDGSLMSLHGRANLGLWGDSAALLAAGVM